MTIWWSLCRAVRGMRAWDAFAGKHLYGWFLLYDDNHSPRVMSKARWFFYCWYACDDFPARGDLCEGPFLGRVRLFMRGWFVRGVFLLCGQLLEDFGYFT